MSCSWIIEHRLRSWRRKLQPLGHPRREVCGKPSVPVSVRVGMFTSQIELCAAHKRITQNKKVTK